MADVQHSDIDVGDIHKPNNWQYADATARTSATGFAADDVGKIARQLDDDSFWLLTNNSPITWKQITDPANIGGGAGVYGNAFEESSDESLTTTTSTSYVSKLNWTSSSLPAGTYRVGMYMEAGMSSGYAEYEVRFQVDGTTVLESGHEARVASYLPYACFYYITVPGSTTVTVNLAGRRVDNGTLNMRRARVELWRVS